MKRAFFILFLCVAASAAQALCDKKIVVKSSGGSAEYALKSISCIRFSDGNIIMNLNDGSWIEWHSDAVGCMMFGNYEPSIETSASGIIKEGLSFNGNTLFIESPVAVPVTLCTIEGKVLIQTTCRSTLSIAMGDYPKGVYILDINGSTHKIVKR